VVIAIFTVMTPFVSADTLVKSDFQQGSFAKTVDYYDYVRAYATLNGIQTPSGFENWHANMYMTYVNTSGLQLLYAGLESITTDGSSYLRIPMQSFIMHYKASDNSDAILSSTFLMLMAFNETASSLYPNSPDRNDILYASFSLGFDNSANSALPSLNSKTELIPLTHSDDNLQWTWGMKYTNLTALWWRTWIDPNDPHFDNSLPLAITSYDELTFTYHLKIDPSTGTATLQENHVIGRMRDLIVAESLLKWDHYNSTGEYGLLGRKIGDQTIYDYLSNSNFKMSIVNYQTSTVVNHTTYSSTPSGQNVTDTETAVTDTSINTYNDNGAKIFNTDFGTKQAYKLYNYTEDPTETTYSTYDSVARTANAAGFAGDASLFKYQIGLTRFLPLVIVHMYPALYEKAKDTIVNMSRADYFYSVAYPTYGGYRIEHDPTFTAYMATSSASTSNVSNVNQQAGRTGLILLALAIVAVVAVAAVLIARRKPKQISKLP